MISKNILNEGYSSKNTLFFERAYQDKIYTKNNVYLDLSFCSGANLLGHNLGFQSKIYKKFYTKKISNFSSPNIHAVELSRRLKELLPIFSKFIYCNSGSEANIKALRICRALTNKSKVASVTGSWHGSVDQFLLKPSKNLSTVKLSDGLVDEHYKNLIYIPYNEIKATKEILDKNLNQLSCIFFEPIQGCLPTKKAKKYIIFLHGYCKKNNILLVFDEMITGLRTNMSSAQQFFKIKSDISTFGKAFANGMPIGFIGISKKIENKIKKKKLNIYFGGTFSGNSLTSFYAKEYLDYLKVNKKKVFLHLENLSEIFENEINKFCSENNIDVRVYRFFSIIRLVFSKQEVMNRISRDFLEKKYSKKIQKFKKYLLDNNIYYPKNGIIFFSYSTSKKSLRKIIKSFKLGLMRFSK